MCVFMRENGEEDEEETKKRWTPEGPAPVPRLSALGVRQLLLALSFLPRSLLFDQRS